MVKWVIINRNNKPEMDGSHTDGQGGRDDRENALYYDQLLSVYRVVHQAYSSPSFYFNNAFLKIGFFKIYTFKTIFSDSLDFFLLFKDCPLESQTSISQMREPPISLYSRYFFENVDVSKSKFKTTS